MTVRKNANSNFRRRANSSVLIGLGLLSLSIVAGAVIMRRQSPAQRAPQAPAYVAEFDTLELPVPVSFVPAGSRVRDVEFKKVSFPKHQVPRGALSSLAGLEDALTIAPLPASLPLFADNFRMNARGANPVIERIPAGMRAITVRVDATSSVEGWAGSGSVVDVMLIEKDKTSVVAEQVKILSAERVVAQLEGGAAPSVPNTVTLLVTQEQALAINTAIPRGKIAFALRSFDDQDLWRDRTFTADELRGGSGAKDGKGVVSGYAAVKGEQGQKKFALADGRWVKTQVVPEGFMVAGQRQDEKN